VKRAHHLLDELRDIVQGKPRFEITEIAGVYLEGPPLGGGAPAFQPPAQRLVDDLAKGPARALRFRLELGRHVVIQGQRCPQALMLQSRHHDVKDSHPDADRPAMPMPMLCGESRLVPRMMKRRIRFLV
jgi:hypothetical protein